MTDAKLPTTSPTNRRGEPEPYIMRLHSSKRTHKDPLPAPCEQCRERIELLQATVDELIEWAATAYSRQIDTDFVLDDLRKKVDPPPQPFVVPPHMS